jgi:hypothetical protein
MQQIRSKEELDAILSNGNPLDCFLLLKRGLRSSKSITFNDGTYWVYNEIDDTEIKIDQSEFETSFLAEAIKAGALWSYNICNMDTVYLSRTGNSYSYKQTATYYIPIDLDSAISNGYVQNKSKWAQKQ